MRFNHFRFAFAALLTLLLFGLAAGSTEAESRSTDTSWFENLGQPLNMAFLLNYSAGPDAGGFNRKIYMAFHEPDGALLVEITPGKRYTRQYKASEQYPGPWGFTIGPDNKIYLGCAGHLVVFDPKHPDKGLVGLGKPAESETMIWRLATGQDGKLYGGTYPNCKLVSYDPTTGEMKDLGRLDPTEEYARPMVAGHDGWIYTGVGSRRGQVIGYNPATAEKHPMIPDEQRPDYWGRNGGWHLVWMGEDDKVYGEIGAKTYRFENGQATEIAAETAAAPKRSALSDGRLLVNAKSDGFYWLKDPKTDEITKHRFDYEAGCPETFLVANGPDGKVYGSTITPLVMFNYDPPTGKFTKMGQMISSQGEVYSFAHDGDTLYYCAYPEARLGAYDVTQPYQYGKTPDANPFEYGAVGGNGHNRPRAMVVGPDKRVYIGSYCTYGQLGGAMAVFDPQENKVVENYRNVVPNQSIISLAASKRFKQVFAGSSVRGGNGVEPTETEGVFFAWDPDQKKKVAELIPVRGHGHIVSMCANDDRVFMITAKEHNTFGGDPVETALAVYDIEKKSLLLTRKFDFGRPVDTSLGIGPDNHLYGLTERGIIRINAITMDVELLAETPVEIEYGFAINDGYIYFCSGSEVWRFNLAGCLQSEKSSVLKYDIDALADKIRNDHPRLFFNADMVDMIKQRAGGRDRDFFREILGQVDESIKALAQAPPAEEMVITSDTEHVYDDPSEDAAKAAFVYVVTGEKRYCDHALSLLERALVYYDKCFAERKSAGWWSRGRMGFVTAWDWLYNDTPSAQRDELMSRFMESVQRVYLADPPILNENMAGITTGFYGIDSMKWYIGVATVGTGIKADLAQRWLKEGFSQHLQLLQYRSSLCGDDGGAASATVNYAFGAYPWAEHNFYFTYLSATGENIALDWPFSASLANFMWWNLIRGPSLMTFGYGDNSHAHNKFPLRWVGGHLKNIYHFYHDTEWAPLTYFLWTKTGKRDHDKSYFIQPFLTSDMKSPAERFDPDAMPLARYFENLGVIFMRSGFTLDDTYALFAVGGVTGQHKHYDALHFTIYHKGFLALDSGAQWHPNHLLHYYSQTIAHNSLLIQQAGEPPSPFWGLDFAINTGSGGQHRKLGSQALAFETTDDYVYVAADATACYQHGDKSLPEKAELVTRQFVYLKPSYFVILDRVRSSKPEYAKQWLLHLANGPVVSGPIVRGDHGEGRLFCRTVLPVDPKIRVIGGPGQEFVAAGQNWDLRSTAPKNRPWGSPPETFTEEEIQLYGQYRVEVESSQPEAETVFLHVFEATDQNQAEMTPVHYVQDQDMAGVRIETGSRMITVLFDVSANAGGRIELTNGDDSSAVFQLSKEVQVQTSNCGY